MISLELQPETERRLRELASARQEEPAQLVVRALEEYLDLQGWGEDTEDEWAEASVLLAPEILADEAWDEDADGPQ